MKSWLRYIITTLLVTTLFGAYFYYLTFAGKIEQNPVSRAIIAVARPYPALTNPKDITLRCDFHGKNLEVSETLYGSLYDYYKSDPSKKSAYLHNVEKDFVFSYEKDLTVKELATKISSIGAENNLSGDQTLDLAACFMQNIPYDSVKAERILGPDFAEQSIESVIPRYPYETLYDQTGICTDKTYLGAAVINQLGYGTAIMTFDAERHMSLGVAVPAGYGSFGSSYGIMELTGSGFLVGDTPDISNTAGLAINQFQTIPKSSDVPTAQDQSQLTMPSDVIDLADGKIYSRIIDRTATRLELERLKPLLTAAQESYKVAQSNLSTIEIKLADAEEAYRIKPTNATYKAYTTVYNEYLVEYNDAQRLINEYNRLVNLYNSYVAKYQEF